MAVVQRKAPPPRQNPICDDRYDSNHLRRGEFWRHGQRRLAGTDLELTETTLSRRRSRWSDVRWGTLYSPSFDADPVRE